MPDLLTEARSVQDPLVRYAAEIGWQSVSQEDALKLRGGETGLIFREVLRGKLLAFNPGVVDELNVDDILRRIENARNSIEGNRDVLRWLRGGQTAYVPSQKRELNVKVVNFEPLDSNLFQVTKEWQYTNGRYTNRADVVFLINGIPVILVETKAAQKRDGIEDGITQVRRYHRETPELVTHAQVFDVPNIVDFYYGVTWSLDLKNLFNWKDVEKGNFERKVKTFLDRNRFLRLLRDYILFFEKDDELNKIVLRQHQTRAVARVLSRCAEKSKPRGLIWHTQGSGKTVTMLTVAEQLLADPQFDKPTVLMLVDRNELEGQLSGVLRAFKGVDALAAQSKEHLRELLSSDARGLIVSTIHKFDRIPRDICVRLNVFVLVDEAHRTTTGDLGNYLVGALPNATLIGFTGTPIDKTAYGRGTFKTFGLYDERGYLDKYSIRESIEDGTTVPLKYALAPNSIRVPQEQLESEFLALAELEGVADIDDLNRALDRAVSLKNFLKADGRVEQVAKFVAQHFRENVEPLGYKAFVVGVDREACVLLKDALDKLLPAEYSRVVFTPFHNDVGLLKRFHLDEDEEKRVRKAFVNPGAMPKLLIVTEKLLTGFDAPILYCMYLDKPMRDHTLLQAIARVNRPYEESSGTKKTCGMVVDFVGIFDKVERALAFDSDVVASVIENLDVLKDRFSDLIRTRAPEYLALSEGSSGDKIAEQIIDLRDSPEVRNRFLDFFKELETLYEIISPDGFLRPFMDDYLRLAKMYEVAINAVSIRPIMDLAKKTERLVREKTSPSTVQSGLKFYTIDEHTLQALKEDSSSDSSKVVNLARSIAQTVEQERSRNPFLIPIGERAAAVLEGFHSRQTTTNEALRVLEGLVEEYAEASREMTGKGMDERTFAVYWVLKKENVPAPEAAASKAAEVFTRFPNWQASASELRELRAGLYKVLIPALGKGRVVEAVNDLLRAQRRGIVS
ncbi:MAG: type I restriction endonuclease subunit R [Thermoplasmata archaeon]